MNEIPAPTYPMLTRMVSDGLLPDDSVLAPPPPPGSDPASFLAWARKEARRNASREDPMVWTVSHPHPLKPGTTIIRMFDSGDSVDVYSVSDDGKSGLRHVIPAARVRILEEVMPISVFASQIALAESKVNEDEDDDDEDDDDDEGVDYGNESGDTEEGATPVNEVITPPTNGQASA